MTVALLCNGPLDHLRKLAMELFIIVNRYSNLDLRKNGKVQTQSSNFFLVQHTDLRTMSFAAAMTPASSRDGSRETRRGSSPPRSEFGSNFTSVPASGSSRRDRSPRRDDRDRSPRRDDYYSRSPRYRSPRRNGHRDDRDDRDHQGDDRRYGRRTGGDRDRDRSPRRRSPRHGDRERTQFPKSSSPCKHDGCKSYPRQGYNFCITHRNDDKGPSSSPCQHTGCTGQPRQGYSFCFEHRVEGRDRGSSSAVKGGEYSFKTPYEPFKTEVPDISDPNADSVQDTQITTDVK
jgi:hypothetical protein